MVVLLDWMESLRYILHDFIFIIIIGGRVLMYGFGLMGHGLLTGNIIVYDM